MEQLIRLLRTLLPNFPAIKTSLKELNESLCITDEEIKDIKNLVRSLGHVKVAVELLSSNNTNLNDADVIFNTLIEELDNTNNEFINILK